MSKRLLVSCLSFCQTRSLNCNRHASDGQLNVKEKLVDLDGVWVDGIVLFVLQSTVGLLAVWDSPGCTEI